MALSINLNNKKWHSQTERGGTDTSISAVTSKAPLWRASWPGRVLGYDIYVAWPGR